MEWHLADLLGLLDNNNKQKKKDDIGYKLNALQKYNFILLHPLWNVQQQYQQRIH